MLGKLLFEVKTVLNGKRHSLHCRRKAKVEEEEKLRKWTRETAVARKKLAAQQAQARMHVSNVAQAKMAQMQQRQQQGREPMRHPAGDLGNSTGWSMWSDSRLS